MREGRFPDPFVPGPEHYGKSLVTDLPQRIRPDARFDSLDDLIAQMQIDKAQARAVLAIEGGGVIG